MQFKNSPYIIAASILAADYTRLGEEIKNVIFSGADWIHFDVMDNHFVPNLAFTPQLCKAIRKINIHSPIDVHLQANPIHNLIDQFAEAGANHITFHPETTKDINQTLLTIQSYGLKAGIAFGPNESLDILSALEQPVDLIVMMGVSPGFGGQAFIPNTLAKIEMIKRWIQKNKLSIKLAVDGGIHINNINQIALAGADIFMIGTAIFNSNDYNKALSLLREALKEMC